MTPGGKRRFALFPHARRYLIASVLTLLPLWITDWSSISCSRTPLVSAVHGSTPRRACCRGRRPASLRPWFTRGLESLLALILTLLGFYLLGWATTQMIGKRLLGWLDVLLDRIPLVKAIYGSLKRLITAFQATGGNAQRVVLIGFPSEEMKTIGLVTRTLVDRRTGEQLAVVYVPTSPNLTSGYIEIVPVSEVVPTNWTLDDAMRFIISRGTTAPGNIDFALAPPSPIRPSPNAVPAERDPFDDDRVRHPRGQGQRPRRQHSVRHRRRARSGSSSSTSRASPGSCWTRTPFSASPSRGRWRASRCTSGSVCRPLRSPGCGSEISWYRIPSPSAPTSWSSKAAASTAC